MKNYKLAWRNLWRNRRRTIITATSIFFAVFFALFMRSLQIGSYDYMYKNVIESYSGYIQVQQKDWWDEKTVDNTFIYNSELEAELLKDENVSGIIPRMESFALASSGPNTKGVIVMGIEPEKESHLSKIKSKVIKFRLDSAVISEIQKNEIFSEKTKEIASLFSDAGYYNIDRMLLDLNIDPEEKEQFYPFFKEKASYPHAEINPEEPGVWLGDKLASFLEINPGDTLVLMGQGYHGTTSAGKYEIKGLIKLPLPDISSRIVYMPYDIAQDFYNTGERLTSVVLHLNNNDDDVIEETIERISKNNNVDVRLIEWREMNDIIIQQMEADNISGQFMIAILYLVIGFGIFGTILMMTAERKREFGVLVALGMQKKKLSIVMIWEMIYMGMLGIGTGMLVCIPIILYGVQHPFIFKGEIAHMMEQYDFAPQLAFQPIGSYFLWQLLIVSIMIGISTIHPIRKISKMKVVNALRA